MSNSRRFRKCGEITASLINDENEFYLNCDFCECTYLHLSNFIKHLYDEHLRQLPSSLFKQTTKASPLYSQEFLDLDCDKSNLEDDLEMLDARKDSIDSNFIANNFETVILAPDEVGVKEELLEIKEEEGNEVTDSEDLYNDIDATQSDDVMVSDSETAQTQNKRVVKDKNCNRKKKVRKAASDKSQTDSKPRSKNIKITDAIIDDSQCIVLAEIHKKHKCLWDEKDIAYRFVNRRNDAMAAAREEFNNQTGLNLTEYEFESEVLRIRKICSYEKKQKIKCKEKNMEYNVTCKYYDHIKYLELDVPPYVCAICEDQHRSLGALKVHEATHDGSKPFKCYECGQGFRLAIYLTQHCRRHAKDHQYHCEKCNKSFTTSTELIIHMRSHTGEKPFVCSLCGSTFTSSSGLIEHDRRQHKKDRIFKCDICSKSFYTSSTLKGHKQTHTNARDYKCQICDKAFKIRKHLIQHNRIHDAVKRYLCKICGKRFAQYAGLSGHMKSHNAISIIHSIDKIKLKK